MTITEKWKRFGLLITTLLVSGFADFYPNFLWGRSIFLFLVILNVAVHLHYFLENGDDDNYSDKDDN